MNRSPMFAFYRCLLFQIVIAIVLGFTSCSPHSKTSKEVEEAKSATEPHLTSEKDEVLEPEIPTQKIRKNEALRFLGPPRLKKIEVPNFSGAHSIWGATGRDHQGRIYLGVSAYGVENPSARLLRLDPSSNQFKILGSVNEKLVELKQRRSDPIPETQMKIHSKIVQAADGRMYFGSQDENGEESDGSKNALYGGRLFSLDPRTNKWECILRTPEGLIAVACKRRYVVAMGYFGHVIYQFDTETRKTRSIRLGTVGGHVSRNLFVDSREHIFAVRLANYTGIDSSGVTQLNGQPVRATLVELDEQLHEIAQTPLDDYQPTSDTDSHGMTAFVHMLNGDTVFVTHSGAIWHVSHRREQPRATVSRLGWFHPGGNVYVASLFCPAGLRYIGGFAKPTNQQYDWVVYDIEERRSTSVSLNETSRKLLEQDSLLIYGCDTLGDQLQAYVVGWHRVAGGYGPSVLRIDWPELE